MDTKIFALIIFVGVLGTFMEAQATHFGYPYPYGNGRLRGPTSVNFDGISRSKREIGDSNGETTTSQATTTTPSSTNPTTPSSTTSSSSTTPSSTTQSSTTPSTTTPSSTSPTTTPSTSPTITPTDTTTDATSPTTTPASTSVTTSATTPSTSPTTPSTTTPESTKSSSKPKKSTDNDVQSRSNFDESEDSTKKPGSPSKGDKTPTPGPFGPGIPGPGFGPGFDPYFGGYPGFNSIPGGAGPNYAWTGTNNGPGYASAGASAGSFAGGYPGYSGAGYPAMGYPGVGYPGVGYPGAGYPRAEPPMTTESPSLNNRGGFQDNSPNYGDPLYNAGPGFFFPGQFPSFNDPTFDMIRQIQAQIEAQHQANMEAHNRLANEAASYGGGSYGGGSYGGGVPQIASASIGLGPDGGFQSGLISPGAPGLESRFAEELPAPAGNSFGVFSSSSSSSRTGPDGKQISHKSSITGVNDNGKVSFRTVHD